MTISGSMIARDDTLLGICFALGEDFGFNPFYLRLVLAAVMLWNLPAALGAYAALGTLVAISRWLAPAPPTAETFDAKDSDRADERGNEFRLAA